MEFVIPRPMKVEHDELYDQLRKATQEADGVGEAAKAVAKLMHPHFLKEEEYALPPLGLLPLLAKGSVTPEMAGVLALTDKLKAELDQMLAEHKSIVAALKLLAEVARRENKMEYVECADTTKSALQFETKSWLPGDSNHELDKIFKSRNLLILQTR